MRRSFRYSPPSYTTGIEWAGVRGPSGQRYFEGRRKAGFKDDPKVDRTRIYFRVEEVANRPATFARLARGGLPMIPTGMQQEMLDELSLITAFPDADLIEKPGWHGSMFALSNGRVAAPPGIKIPHVAFERVNGRYAQKSKTKGWHGALEPLVIDQPYLIFSLSASFAAPLLALSEIAGSVGFELVGPASIGKSLATEAAAAVWGSNNTGGRPFIFRCATAFRDLEAAAEICADHVLALEGADTAFALESERRQAEMIKSLALVLSGQRIANHSTGSPPPQLLLFSTSRRSLREYAHGNGAAVALSDMLYTINVPADRPFGILDHIQEDYGSASATVAALRCALGGISGSAGSDFLKQTVKLLAEKDAGYRTKLQGLIDEFRKEASVDLNNGSRHRCATAFALVYAGGKLAQEAECVPSTFDVQAAVLQCYRQCVEDLATTVPFHERLAQILLRPDVLDLGSGTLPKVSKKMRRATVAYIWSYQGQKQLMVPLKRIRKLFSDWSILKREPEVLALLYVQQEKSGDGKIKKRYAIKRQAGKGGKKERMYCFNISDPPPVAE